MSSTALESSSAAGPTASNAVRTGGIAVAAAAVGNLLVLVAGRLAGADMSVIPAGATDATDVGALMVLLTAVLPLLLGTVALAVAARWGLRGWTALAWTGLAIGVLTVVMPLSVDASTSTKTTLALMHLVTGGAWFLAVHRAIR